jgi:DNA-binding MarR family transcriptional regulator
MPNESAPFDLDKFIPFLIYRVMAKAAAVASADYAAWGISIREARLLLILLGRDGISAGELSEISCVEASALSHMLRHLVGKKLIRRVRDPKERRAVNVFLTKAGHTIAVRCHTLSAEHQDMYLHGLSKAKVETLRETLQHMLAHVSEKTSSEPSLTHFVGR